MNKYLFDGKFRSCKFDVNIEKKEGFRNDENQS